jgi:CheY-like chemotaxis protein
MDVLLVEDEPLVREAVAEALDEAGLEVARADSAEAALAALGVAPNGHPTAEAAPDHPPPDAALPAVLVTDVNLGPASALDGFALAAALRRRWPGIGVVVITGRMANLARCAELAPPERHFLKPFAPEALVQAVRELAAAPPASDLACGRGPAR